MPKELYAQREQLERAL